MANLREPSLAFNRELLAGARWFAGKGRELVDVATGGRLEPPGSRGAVLELVDVGTAARIEPPGSRGAVLELVDVRYGDGASERYALALRDGRECAGDDPLWPALARAAGVDAGEALRFLADDLSNTVVLLDCAHVFKLYRRPELGPHPEVELLAALDGSPHAPRLLGALERDGAILACLQALVAGTPVGWEGLIARLARGEQPTGEPAELARVTASLHLMLAERLGVTHGGLASSSAPVPGHDLGALAPLVDEGLAPLDRLPDVPLQRVHGDLHVGQYLRTDDALVVVDWEGEPGLPLAERNRPRPALRDLASLRLSLAHAARAAYRRSPELDWRSWSVAARDEALEAYASLAGPVDVPLLHALEVEKELSELAYAERWLPEWLYAPRDVLPFVLGADA